MSAPCPHMPSCAMYSLFKYSGTLNTWKINYCTADYSRCERHRRTAAGHPVPINLMPNGALLKKRGSGEAT